VSRLPDPTTVLTMLRKRIGSYRGGGRNHEGEDFHADLVLASAGGGAGILLTFTAVAAENQPTAVGTVLHTENSIIAVHPEHGLVLAQIGSNLGVLLLHPLRRSGSAEDRRTTLVFGYGNPDGDGFAEELSLHIHPDGTLGYAFAWGRPGDAFGPRSEATLSLLTDQLEVDT
jgi:hypothetical protein